MSRVAEALPKGTIKVTFKQPTENEATQLVKKWLTLDKYNENLFGTKSDEHADFSPSKNHAYPPALIKHSRLGNEGAIVGLVSIPHQDATEEMIQLSEIVGAKF